MKLCGRTAGKSKAKAWRKWNRAKKKGNWNLGMFRMRRKSDRLSWLGVAGGLLGGLAGAAAYVSIRRSRSGSAAQENFPMGDQAPPTEGMIPG